MKNRFQLKNKLIGFLIILAGLYPAAATARAETEEPDGTDAALVLPVEDFVRLAAKNDTVFEQILIDQLALDYRKDLLLPARDLVMSVKGQYNFMLDGNREDVETSLSLDKLFPYAGTGVSASYENTPSPSSGASSSEFNFLVSQPIAENAFGHATRLRDKIIGLENDVARYQIVEAYEDYLASLINVYFNWHAAYESVKIGRSSYRENSKLLENINERSRQKIALPIDVNKVRLLVINKEEDLLALEESFKNLTNIVSKAVRYSGRAALAPADPASYQTFDIRFDEDYMKFTRSSRTYAILGLLENKSSLEVKKNADDLLPSTNLLVGYKVDGDDWRIKNEDNMLYAGISVEWPFPGQVERAEYQAARIAEGKTRLVNQNKYLQLLTDLNNLYLQIQREQELIRLAEAKIRLAEEVLADEAENYSYGKVSLNDYIDAVNRLDINRFNRIARLAQLKKLQTEWLRLTDKLVTEKVLEIRPGLMSEPGPD